MDKVIGWACSSFHQYFEAAIFLWAIKEIAENMKRCYQFGGLEFVSKV